MAEKQNVIVSDIEKDAENDKPSAPVDIPEDDDLDVLLDSALDDFDKKPEPKQVEPSTETESTIKKDKPPENQDISAQQEELFNELFNIAGVEAGHDGDAAFEKMMRTLMDGQPEMMQQIETIAGKTPDPGLGQDQDNPVGVDDTLQQTLNNLAQNIEGMQETEPGGDADLLRMLSGMGLGGEEGSTGDNDLSFMPMMQNMMQSLMSKDILYPSLKEISDKYPTWLEENTSKLSQTDLEKYTKQYEHMKVIVTEFESENASDSESTKKTRFDKIMDVMQSMQELGQPPKDLVGDIPAGFDFANGMPSLPGGEGCSIM